MAEKANYEGVEVMTFAQLMKKFRIHNKVSQQQLASSVGIGRVSVTYYENGTHEPVLSTAIKISRFLGFDINEVIL